MIFNNLLNKIKSFCHSEESVLHCYTFLPHVHEYAKIDYAINYAPSWWRETPAQLSNPTSNTIKSCVAVLDYFKKGIVIPSWFEMDLVINSKSNPEWYTWVGSSSDLDTDNSHRPEQFAGFAGESGKNIKILVLDTEVYSNTGGQSSKSTPTAATAKFAAAGKTGGKKDLAMQAISYGNVYVARVAFGANPQQTLLAMREAEAYDGPAIILAYSHCIAHGYDLKDGLDQQYNAVASGHWPLLRYNPTLRIKNKNPFILDSVRPTIPLKEYAYKELRYKSLLMSQPAEAERLMKHAQELVNLKWRNYEELATKKASDFVPLG
jgi:hypothetical protein